MDSAAFPSEPVAVAPEASAALRTGLRRLRHDLGKSMSLQLRFAGPGASEAELVEALAQDVIHTRRSPQGSVSARVLFEAARPWLVGEADVPGARGIRVDLSDDEAFRALADAVSELARHEAEIWRGALRGATLERLVAAAHAGTRACRALVDRYPGVAGG